MSETSFQLNRRALVQASLASLALPMVSATAWADEKPAPTQVVQTHEGKVRGVESGGVKLFRGIRYGASTAGKNRFMPPQPPEPWSGVQDAFDYGLISPQKHPSGKNLVRGALKDMPANPLSTIRKMSASAEGEDCLNLNLWTPGFRGKRPVMVWFHGGGYNNGSGSTPLFDGTYLANKGDVVVVTVTHRLSFLGFTYLGDKDERFGASGNVGMLDLQQALIWVRDNIESFGGDPDNVMIFGESGGAGKVSNMLAMPSAKGLFHRAALQSGASIFQREIPDAIETSAELLQELGLSHLPATEQVKTLQDMPLDALTLGYFNMLQRTGRNAMEFSPLVDGDTLPAHPCYPFAPSVSAHVPVLLGINETEHAYVYMGRPAIFDLTEEELLNRLTMIVSLPTAKKAVALYKKHYPDASPARLLFLINTDHSMRKNTNTMADMRAAGSETPTYVYNLNYTAPYMDGGLGTPHVVDLPLIFGTYGLPGLRDLVGADARAQRMSEIMSDCWLNFARSGVPSSPKAPAWKPYTVADRATMIFDDKTEVVSDPLADLRRFWVSADYQII